jgi:hypothetical protein
VRRRGTWPRRCGHPHCPRALQQRLRFSVMVMLQQQRGPPHQHASNLQSVVLDAARWRCIREATRARKAEFTAGWVWGEPVERTWGTDREGVAGHSHSLGHLHCGCVVVISFPVFAKVFVHQSKRAQPVGQQGMGGCVGGGGGGGADPRHTTPHTPPQATQPPTTSGHHGYE